MELNNMRIDVIPIRRDEKLNCVNVRFAIRIFGQDTITVERSYFPDDFEPLFDRIFDDVKEQIHDFLKIQNK